MAGKKKEVENVSSLDSFRKMISGPNLSVVHFWSDWANQCGPMDEALKILVQESDLQEVNFLRVDAEDVSEVSLEFEVAAVPTILFCTQGKIVERVEGAKVADVTKKVKELSSKEVLRSRLPAPSPTPDKASPGDGGKTKDLDTRLKELTNAAPAMLFMKGSPDAPECGFSRTTVALLNSLNAEYGFFDILTDDEVRQGLKEFSKWPTYPQLYVKGEMVGGLDILKEMNESGELEPMLPKKVNLNDRLKLLINQAPVMVFMKGDRTTPKCGFSRQLMEILADTTVSGKALEFSTFDILSDEEVRQGLKTFSNWPTYPQVYAKGELVGGLDIIKELKEGGELEGALLGQ